MAEGDDGEARETIDEQQARQEDEGLEHPAPSAVEEADDEDDPMEGPAPTG